MSSSPTRVSESTTTFTVWRRPAARTSSSSSSNPAAATIGSSTPCSCPRAARCPGLARGMLLAVAPVAESPVRRTCGPAAGQRSAPAHRDPGAPGSPRRSRTAARPTPGGGPPGPGRRQVTGLRDRLHHVPGAVCPAAAARGLRRRRRAPRRAGRLLRATGTDAPTRRCSRWPTPAGRTPRSVAAVIRRPGLTGRLEPLRAARTAHAAALDAAGGRTTPPPEQADRPAAGRDLARGPGRGDGSARAAANAVGATSAAAGRAGRRGRGLLLHLRGGAEMTGVPAQNDDRRHRRAAEAVQRALAAEHAALWCYSLAVAFLADQAGRARTDPEAHRELRDSPPRRSPTRPAAGLRAARLHTAAARHRRRLGGRVAGRRRDRLRRRVALGAGAPTSARLRSNGLRAMVDSTGRRRAGGR